MSLAYTGERAIPWNRQVGAHIMYPHIARYAWACQWCWGKSVLDLGCGAGYGSFMLSWVAKSVMGVDIDTEAVCFAQLKFKAPNLAFIVRDITDAVLPGADVCVAFEVLEHLDYPQAVADAMTGMIIYSIPIGDSSRFHKHAYSLGDAERLIGGEIYHQSSDGQIAIASRAQFQPAYVLGVRR